MTQSPEQTSASAAVTASVLEEHEPLEISRDWQAARAPADLHLDPTGIDALSWISARVPGTAAGALHDAGQWQLGDRYDFDAEDWWFRTSFDAQPATPGEEVRLCLDGIATVAEVYLNGELVLESESMFAAHALDVADRLRERNELAIRCRALGPLLQPRRRPRARWRTRLVTEGNLRFFRTMLLGRCPGIAPGPAAVGPWRAVRLERRRKLDVQELTLRPRIEGQDGILSVAMHARALDGAEVSAVELALSGPSGSHRTVLELDRAQAAEDGLISARGELRIPDVARWWPHTHGEPLLHDVSLVLSGPQGSTALDAGRIGFRELAPGADPAHDIDRDGLALQVNGVGVFLRGAVWTPIDPIGLAPSQSEIRAELTRMRDGGMNMVRLPGTGAYETAAFHNLCDELGVLVWQDFMFANLDYPFADESFRAVVERELRAVLNALGSRPSLAVLCGNSEVEQQAAMMGFDYSLGRGELFGELLPEMIRASAVDAIYVPSAPCGGDLPFRADVGIGTYYAVGCYLRPLDDVRRASVRFAAECLAFSHIPSEEAIEAMLPEAPGQLAGNHPLWKAGIPRENEADWDFEDIRDHYLGVLFNVDVPELRHINRTRYLELSRTVTGEILAEVFGEWRRAGSPCGGGLVLWLRDQLPGAGWGLVDHRGGVKLAYHHLKRVLAPVAVWTVDENLGGVMAHVANDRPTPLSASLRVSLYCDGEFNVGDGTVAVELAPHTQAQWNVETLVGHFVDASWAYRFGPPAQDAIVLTLQAQGVEGGAGVISQAVRFPARRPLERESPEQLGLTASLAEGADGDLTLTLAGRRLVYGIELHVPGFLASDDGFTMEPGGERVLSLRRHHDELAGEVGWIGAVNMNGRVKVALP